MKKIFLLLALFISIAGIFLSCKKEKSCEGCRDGNQPPIAVAGSDQVITLPTDSISLDGSASNDPDGTISEWLWTKISGPATFNIVNTATAKTIVRNPDTGVYRFELTVKDNEGLPAKDTIQITLNDRSQPNLPSVATCEPLNRPTVNMQLVPIGNLSVARAGIAAVAAGNNVFYAGGYNASGPVSRVDIYHVASNTWSTAELSTARAYITAVSLGNKVFFAGGGYNQPFSTRVDIYDLTTQSWSIAELSLARDALVTAAVGNKVFFAAGFIYQTAPSSRVDIYDIATQTWSTTELSEARTGLAAVSTENKVYFAGGWNGLENSSASNKIDIYDDASMTWSSSSLNTARAFHAGIFKNGKIYWAGGERYIEEPWYGINVSTYQVEIKEVNTQVLTFSNLFRTNQFIKAFEKDDKVIYVQAIGKDFMPIYFDIHNTISNTWSIGLLNQSGIYNGGTIISNNNSIYVAGGWLDNGGNGGLYTTQVWKLEF